MIRWIARFVLVVIALALASLVVIGFVYTWRTSGPWLTLAVFPGMPLGAWLLVAIIQWAVRNGT